MGWSPWCYIPSFVKIGPPVHKKKIFEGFLPYMGVAAILVMWPGCREQNFVPPSQGGSTLNLALIGQAVSEKKMFEHCGRRRTDDGRRRTPDHGYTISSPMSLRLRWAKNPAFCIYAKTKSQISGAVTDQCLKFCYINSTVPILSYSEKSLRVNLTPSNLYLYSKNEVWRGQEKNQ